MMITNPFYQKQDDVIRWIKTKDTGNPLALVYNKIVERSCVSVQSQFEDFDPEQVATRKMTQILLNKVIYANSYLMN